MVEWQGVGMLAVYLTFAGVWDGRTVGHEMSFDIRTE